MSVRTNVIMLTLAARTAGVVTRAELRDAGLAGSTIDLRCQQGFLLKVWRGLYEVPELTDDRTPLFRAVKSVPGSVVSHRSAARLWGFPLPDDGPGAPVHITALAGRARSGMPDVVVHRSGRPDIGEVRHLAGVPTTSPARTIADLAGLDIGDRRLAHVIETQVVAGQPTIGELSTLIADQGSQGVAGAARLQRIVGDLFDDRPVADSLLERRLARLLRSGGIAGFEPQFRPPWYDGRRGVVDLANRAVGLIIEVDGRRWHATAQAMADDRRRDRVAAGHGWQVLRVTSADLVDRPDETVDHVAAAIAARRYPPGEVGP